MDGKISIDTKSLVAASQEFHAHADALRKIWQDLQGAMRSAGEWWGDDSAGWGFAHPDPKKNYPGYQAVMDNVLFSSDTGNACGPGEMEQMVSYLSSLADALATWADYWRYVEDANTMKPKGGK
jgi:hypothetical protein